MEHIRKVAHDGSPAAQFLYGIGLIRGERVNLDVEEGMNYIRKAASQGNDPARLQLWLVS
jgi:TPR repeat protein